MLKTDTIQITPELLVLIAEVDEFKGAYYLALRQTQSPHSLVPCTKRSGDQTEWAVRVIAPLSLVPCTIYPPHEAGTQYPTLRGVRFYGRKYNYLTHLNKCRWIASFF